jgi:hypothetical protein
MNKGHAEAIMNWETPKSVKDIQVFLGLTNYYRQFIPNFSEIVLPLTRLTQKHVKFLWEDNEQKAFEKLKSMFSTTPILQHIDQEKSFVVETDSSDFAMGAVLFQEGGDKKLHPVAYHSRKWTSAEINYEIYDKELNAILDSFQHWRHLLMGTQESVQVKCDHKNLEYFMSTKKLNRRQMRWAQYLADFNFKVCYTPGMEQVLSDALSRQPSYKLNQEDHDGQYQTLLQAHMIATTTFSSELEFIKEVKEGYQKVRLNGT